tara:strand:+ start:265 stop:477 length:213 start_codon:yes stop_codon:yes gene_type:complete
MKFIILITLIGIPTINPVINAHENHDHEIHKWSNSKNMTTQTDSILNSEELEDKKNNYKKKLVKIFHKIN